MNKEIQKKKSKNDEKLKTAFSCNWFLVTKHVALAIFVSDFYSF